MLKHLYIKNFALIDVLDIDFTPGFSVITGETGAGKSIVLGAIGLLLGQRADSKSVKTNCQKCTIEAHFDLSNYGMGQWFEENDLDSEDLSDCIIRRELTAAGKSRGFINDTPATLAQMRELGEMLIDVHSQHQNLLLQKENFQLSVLDILAGNINARTAYRKAYDAYREEAEALEELRRSIAETQSNEEFMRFQLQELQKAALTADEQELLEQEQEVASHSEDIKTALYEADGLLADDDNGAMNVVRQALTRMQNAAAINSQLQPLADRLDEIYIELKDISSETSSVLESVDFDPERLQYINDRLSLIYDLERKYQKKTIEELLEELERLESLVNGIDNSDELLREKENTVAKLLKTAEEKAAVLTETRKKVAKKIEKEIVERLDNLGMPKVDFVVDIQQVALAADGQDKVAYLFSANKGMALRPVAQVASGGEIARLMLSLKAMISGAVKLPTIIFDEIDTGVSGRVAEKMADIMVQMGAANRQVLSITHLPQIAAMGSRHYRVEKHEAEDGTTTSVMRLLTNEERVDEIAQMLSGSDITDAARINARALLKL